MPEDAELLRAYIESRSESAFAELVRRHLNLVYSAALRRVGGDTHLAEDISQEVFVALARQGPSLRDRPALTGWLYTASRFAAVQVVRAERRRRAREQEAIAMKELSEPAAPDPDWDRLRPVLDDMMDQLNECDRDALLLRFFEGQPFANLGARLNVTEEAARKRVDRALEKLRGLLARRGVKSSAAAVGLMLANQTVIAAPATFAATVAATAVSSTAGSATPLVGVFYSMNASKITVGIAGVILILTVGVAIHEGRVRRDADVALVSANRDYDHMLSERKDLEKFAHDSDSNIARLKKTVNDAQRAEASARAFAASEAQTAKEAAAWNPAEEGRAFLARHPEVKQALINYQNARLDFQYGPFYKLRGLTPDQIEQFRAIWREVAFQPWNVGFSGKFLMLGTGTNMTRSEMEVHLRALVGDDGMKEMAKVSQTTAARAFVVELATNLSFTDTPLTAAQSDALVEIINSHRTNKSSSGTRAVDWEAASADARRVLLESQLSALEAVRSRDTISQAMTVPAMKW